MWTPRIHQKLCNWPSSKDSDRNIRASDNKLNTTPTVITGKNIRQNQTCDESIFERSLNWPCTTI